jgi:hypothetical protein
MQCKKAKAEKRWSDKKAFTQIKMDRKKAFDPK